MSQQTTVDSLLLSVAAGQPSDSIAIVVCSNESTFLAKSTIAYCIYYIKLQFSLSVYLSVCTPPPFFRHDRRTATKFGTHVRVDMGLILS